MNPEARDEQLEQISERLAHWQGRLGLEEWQIDVTIQPDPLEDLSFAGCRVTAPSKAALWVREDATAVDLDWICAHELVGLMVQPCREWLAGPAAVARLDGWTEGTPLPPEVDAAVARSTGVDLWEEQLAQQITKALLGTPPPLVVAWWFDLLFMDEGDGDWFRERQERGEVPAGLRTTGPEPWAARSGR